jgi:hypothetical protein
MMQSSSHGITVLLMVVDVSMVMRITDNEGDDSNTMPMHVMTTPMSVNYKQSTSTGRRY